MSKDHLENFKADNENEEYVEKRNSEFISYCEKSINNTRTEGQTFRIPNVDNTYSQEESI